MSHKTYIKFNRSIYKYFREYIDGMSDWIKMTNIDDFSNRIMTVSNKNFNAEKYQYGYESANKEINKYWDSLNHTWTYNNEVFDNNVNFKVTNTSHKIDNHSYYVVWYRGNLYWMVMYHYFPMCQLHEFKSINKKPGKFIKWTNVRHLKSVYNVTQNKII